MIRTLGNGAGRMLIASRRSARDALQREAATPWRGGGRPHEPHKYADPADQERLVPMLLRWIAAYYTRDGVASYGYHRAVFDAFAGPKRELTELAAP